MISRRAVLGTGVAIGALGAVGYGLWPRLDDYEQVVARQRQVPTAAPPMLDFGSYGDAGRQQS